MDKNNDKSDMTEKGRLLDLSDKKSKSKISNNTSNFSDKLGKVSSISSRISSVGVFKVVFVFLILVALFRIANNPTDFTIPSLQSLLDYLSNAPNISTKFNWFIQRLDIPSFPWPINWVSWVLNQIIDLWSIMVWFGTSLWSVIEYILYVVIWLFLF